MGKKMKSYLLRKAATSVVPELERRLKARNSTTCDGVSWGSGFD